MRATESELIQSISLYIARAAYMRASKSEPMQAAGFRTPREGEGDTHILGVDRRGVLQCGGGASRFGSGWQRRRRRRAELELAHKLVEALVWRLNLHMTLSIDTRLLSSKHCN